MSGEGRFPQLDQGGDFTALKECIDDFSEREANELLTVACAKMADLLAGEAGRDEAELMATSTTEQCQRRRETATFGSGRIRRDANLN